MPRSRLVPSLLLLAAGPVVVGLVETVRRAWVCDDVFISFRYVDHLLQGQGLVFNPGERVEGYTHFLWVILLAACNRLGVDLVTLGRYLPILFFATTLVVLTRRSLRRRDGAWLGLPLAAWSLALHYDAQLFASSGLETAAIALLLLLGLLAVSGERDRYGLAGAVYALATLMRPEGALYAATAGLYLLWRTQVLGKSGARGLADRLRPSFVFAATWAALVVPALAFRLSYYGEILPNTYYAKSGGSSYWIQGWHYTRLYFGIYHVLLAALAAVPAAWVLRRRFGRDLDTAVLAGFQVVVTILYVTRLGGDFMFARFYVPATVLLYLVVEDVLRCSRRRWVEIVAAVLLIGGTLLARLPRSHTFVGREKVEGIVDEANYYTKEMLATLRHQGEVLGRFLQGTPARVALLSGQDAVAYFGKLPYALESQGLTDKELARLPITSRGRPGHERPATQEFLLRRGIHFRLRYGLTVNLELHRSIRFDDLYGEILTYDSALMRQLAQRPGINFVPFPFFLEGYMKSLGERDPRRLQQDYLDFLVFYFIHNEDAPRLARYREALLGAGLSEDQLREAERIAQATLAPPPPNRQGT